MSIVHKFTIQFWILSLHVPSIFLPQSLELHTGHNIPTITAAAASNENRVWVWERKREEISIHSKVDLCTRISISRTQHNTGLRLKTDFRSSFDVCVCVYTGEAQNYKLPTITAIITQNKFIRLQNFLNTKWKLLSGQSFAFDNFYSLIFVHVSTIFFILFTLTHTIARQMKFSD